MAGLRFAALIVCFVISSFPATDNLSTITISGNVDTRIQTQPIEITFVDSSVGDRYGNPVNDDDGFYELHLPNGDHDYDVLVRWQGLAGLSGTCDAGYLGYSTLHPPFLTRDYEC